MQWSRGLIKLTGFSESVNDWNYEEWNFIGRELEESKHGEWSEDNQKGVDVDSFIPMMLYAYPLYDCPTDEQIFKIHKKTNLTVVQNIESENYYLALTGGGMDMSQDIGMAYIIADDNIPFELALSISTQPNLTQYGKDFRKVMQYCKKSTDRALYQAKRRKKECNESIKQSREIDKQKEVKA